MTMTTIDELTEYIAEKAKNYLEETGETIDRFPMSIVDFVIEYASLNCHFPSHFTETNIVYDLSKAKNALAMACVDIYSKSGAEGQISHSENGIVRQYDSSWITFDLMANLPNYVNIFN